MLGFCGFSFGQITSDMRLTVSGDSVKLGGNLQKNTGIFFGDSKRDTIKCVMLCSDTSHDTSPMGLWQCCDSLGKGKELRYDRYNEQVWTMRGYCYYTDYIHVSYLDIKKQPLKYYVWLSIEVK